MGMSIIDAFNPAPLGPNAGSRRSITSVHRRRQKQAVRAMIRDLKRQAANQPAASVVPVAPGGTAPAPTENALLLTFTRDQLRAEAKSRGLANYGRLDKQGLRDLLGVTA